MHVDVALLGALPRHIDVATCLAAEANTLLALPQEEVGLVSLRKVIEVQDGLCLLDSDISCLIAKAVGAVVIAPVELLEAVLRDSTSRGKLFKADVHVVVDADRAADRKARSSVLLYVAPEVLLEAPRLVAGDARDRRHGSESSREYRGWLVERTLALSRAALFNFIGGKERQQKKVFVFCFGVLFFFLLFLSFVFSCCLFTRPQALPPSHRSSASWGCRGPPTRPGRHPPRSGSSGCWRGSRDASCR